jgi:L-ascorbate metabolism protein UlaG (beta-lactamase superfamily)
MDMTRTASAITMIVLLATSAFGADVERTANGDLTITPVRHGTVMLNFEGRVWYIDPWSQAPNLDTLPKADVILITDIHGDHMDPAAIAAVRKDSTVIIAPPAVAATVTQARSISNGESTAIFDVEIVAVPMYNLKRGPQPGTLFHDKGRGNGYILTMGGKRVYFSGDTEATDEMRDLQDIDIAFVRMNLPYTMPPDEAA